MLNESSKGTSQRGGAYLAVPSVVSGSVVEDSNLPVVDHESGDRQMYEEFLNCTTNNYNIQEKENSEEISSNGEFEEFKDCDEYSEDNPIFVIKKYLELVTQKYSQAPEQE